MTCRKCGTMLSDWEPQQNGMCIDCFAGEELVELSPIVSPSTSLTPPYYY